MRTKHLEVNLSNPNPRPAPRLYPGTFGKETETRITKAVDEDSNRHTPQPFLFPEGSMGWRKRKRIWRNRGEVGGGGRRGRKEGYCAQEVTVAATCRDQGPLVSVADAGSFGTAGRGLTPSARPSSQRPQLTNAGEGVEKREPSDTAGRNGNWCSPWGT